MKNFYFTFGSNHLTLGGQSLQHYWIRVRASSYGEARTIFCTYFSRIFMEKVDKWAFEYEEEGFDPKFFPSGEFLFLDEEHIKKVVTP